MECRLVDFENIEWTSSAKGLKYKAYVIGNQKIRLVEFSEGFVEENWCTKGHTGYVLDGEYSLDLNGKLLRLKKGDAFVIFDGEEDKHKAILKQGEKVLLFMVEKA